MMATGFPVSISVINRQRACKVNLRLLRQIVQTLLVWTLRYRARGGYSLRAPDAVENARAGVRALENPTLQHSNTPFRGQAMSRPATGHGTKSGVMSLAIHLVGELEILRLNEAFLGHRGPTDVITFGYGSDSDFGVPFLPAGFDDAGWTSDSGPSQIGEIFICTKIAREQAKRYQTSWQNELVRYLVHGLLHLCGHDDQKATARRHMKRDENRLLRRLARQFDFSQISKP